MITLAAMLLAMPAYAEIQRDYRHPWEKEIGYAAAVRHGDTLYVSGVVGQGATMAEQMADCYRKIGEILTAHGLNSRAVVKETIYTRDIEAVKAAIAVRKLFYTGDAYPAATWVQVDRLFNASDDIEIEVQVAFLSEIQ
ncbi:RidA family protein [Asticcacaulis sp. AC402]|uniref:RidA family protein n=1 Tax=Asticcacaulis sp. AC402 TaxID=1282361 RepID=UPI00138AD923|nr:RidA family protein [Asticcacaulis sp. AC402]